IRSSRSVKSVRLRSWKRYSSVPPTTLTTVCLPKSANVVLLRQNAQPVPADLGAAHGRLIQQQDFTVSDASQPALEFSIPGFDPAGHILTAEDRQPRHRRRLAD